MSENTGDVAVSDGGGEIAEQHAELATEKATEQTAPEPDAVYSIDGGGPRPLAEVPSLPVKFYGTVFTFYMPTEEGLFQYLEGAESLAEIEQEYQASQDTGLFLAMLKAQREFSQRFFVQSLTRDDQLALNALLTNVRIRPTVADRIELVHKVVGYFMPMLNEEFRAMGLNIAERYAKLAAMSKEVADTRTAAEKRAGVSAGRTRRARSR